MANKILYINNVKCMNVESRENLRRCAYEAFKNNESGYAVSRKLKVRKSTVYRWYKEFKTKGETAISESKRGADVSEHAALSKEERNKLEKDVRDKPPDQLKFDFVLWSSKAIKEYVQRKFGINISRRTARRYMNALGFTYQCPTRRAKEQNPKAVADWLENTYPSIKAQAVNFPPNFGHPVPL